MRCPRFLLRAAFVAGVCLTTSLLVVPALAQSETELYDNGQMYFGQKQYPEAEAQFRKAIAADPRYKEAWQALADALKAQGKAIAAAKVQRMADAAPAARAGEPPALTPVQKQALAAGALPEPPNSSPPHSTPKAKATAKPVSKILPPERPNAVKETPPQPKVVPMRAVTPRPGYIIGRVRTEKGRAIPKFTVQYSGFQDGKLASYNLNGDAVETVSGSKQGSGGYYALKVPKGAYRVSAYVTYSYKNRLYNFELEPVKPPKRHDYDALGLDKLKGGLVRDFVLKMTAPKPGASDESETLYDYAYYGGRVNFDARQTEGILGGGHTPTPALRDAYPGESVLTITLTPTGPLVDGSTSQPVTITKTLSQDGLYTFCERGVYPGVYTATALLTTPQGQNVPLRVSNKPARTVLKGSPDGYDMVVMDWHPSVTLDFLPNDLGPIPRMGVQSLTLYLGK